MTSRFIIERLPLLFYGCSEDKAVKNNIYDSQLEVKQLKSELESKTKEINMLNNKIDELEQEICKIEQDKDDGVEINNDVIADNKSFNVFNESINVMYEKITYDDFNELSVRELLGEPLERLEYEDPHSGQTAIDLIYREATFTYNIYEGQQKLKWYTIISDLFSTNRGVSVGASRAQVLDAYGSNYYGFYSNDEFITIGEKQGIRFELDNDFVSQIIVWFSYE